jgi:glycolate oxidase
MSLNLVINELRKLGVEIVEDKEKYREDMGQFKNEPDIIVRVRGTEEVAEVVKLANKFKIPVVAWGAGSSLTGAPVTNRGILIDLSQMNRIIEFDDINWVVHVEAGVVLDNLNSFLNSKGFFFPPDPASSFMCTIGGAISNGAGGMRCVKYGTFRDWVLALRVVLSDGTIVKFGEPLSKNRAGYDLVRLMVGSEGTLGIITEAWLKVIPLPDYKIFRVLAFFYDEDSIANAIIGIRKNRIQPEISEFMDIKILNAVRQVFNLDVEGVGALLIDVPEYQYQKLLNLLKSLNAKIKIAESNEEKEELYKVRVYAPLAVRSLGKYHMSEDIVVPVNYLPLAFKKIREFERNYGLMVPTLGHIGDGNLHPIIIYNDGEEEVAKKLFSELCKFVISIGGSITGEHGIGIQKAELLTEQLKLHNGIKVLELMRSIKYVFDPNRILNPDKYVERASQKIYY